MPCQRVGHACWLDTRVGHRCEPCQIRCHVLQRCPRHAQSKRPASTQQDAFGGMQTRLERMRTSTAAARAEEQHEHEIASMTGQGRDKNRKRGRGRRGGLKFHESRPAGPGPGSFSCWDPLYVAMQVTKALHMCNCQNLLLTVAASANHPACNLHITYLCVATHSLRP